MERFRNGPFPKTDEILKIEKRLTRCNRYERARSLLRLLFLIALPLAVLITALSSLKALPLTLVGCVIAVVLCQLSCLLAMAFLRIARPGTPKYDDLLNTYVRLLMMGTQSKHLPFFPDSRLQKEMVGEAERYARTYVVPKEERGRIYKARSIVEEGERLRAEYEEYLYRIASEEGERILLKKVDFVRRTERWRKANRRAYTEDQYKLIDANINRLLQKFSHDANAENGFYMDFVDYITTFHSFDKETAELDGRVIPTADVKSYYLTIVKEIKRIRFNELKKALSDKELDDLRDYLNAYEQVRQKYVFFDPLPTIDVERYDKYYIEARANKKRCFSCHRKFHERYKKICDRCGHYICPRCHKCYCSKYIGHNLENFYNGI